MSMKRLKRDKSKRSKVDFSDQFIPAEATETLISEKLSKKAAKRARRREKRQAERLSTIQEQEWRKISVSNPPPIPTIPTKKEEDNFVVVSPNNNNKKRKRK